MEAAETSLWVMIAVIFYGIAISFMAVKSKMGSASVEQFAVGNKDVSPILVGLSLAANMTSAATFIINPGLVYLYGFSGFLAYAIAAPLGMFTALALMTRRFRRGGEKGGAVTIPQWLSQRFASPQLGLMFSFLSLLQVSFIVLIAVGLTLVLSGTLSLPTTPVLVFLLLFTVVYISVGGAAVHIRSNSFQSSIMVLVAVVLLFSGFGVGIESFSGLWDSLREQDPLLVSIVNPESAIFRDIFEVFIANFIVGIAIVCQPHILSKSLYLRKEDDIRPFLITAIGIGTLFFLVLFTGLYARVLLPVEHILPPDRAMTEYIRIVLPESVGALVTLGLLAAGFSTLEGLLLALSSIFSVDVLRPLWRREGVDAAELARKDILGARAFMVVLAVAVFFFSVHQIENPSLSVAIFAQNGVYALFAASVWPIIWGIFAKKRRASAAFASALTALVVHFGMYYGEISTWHNNPGVTATFAIIAAGIVSLIANILSQGVHNND